MRATELVFFVAAPPLVLFLVLFCIRDEIRRAWREALFLAAACALFFHRILFFGEALSQEDANLLQMRFFTLYHDAVRGFAEIPFWNPCEGAGVPNLAHPLSAMFYPLTPLFLADDLYTVMNAFVVCHYFLAGFFALLVGKRMFRTHQAALAFAVLYAFNGWAMTRAAHQPAIEYLFAYAWLPLAALAFEKAVDGAPLVVAAVVGGAALAWMGMTSPNVFVYGSVLLAAAAALRLAHLFFARRSNAAFTGIAAVVVSFIFAWALGAVEYLPARELSAYSTTSRLGVMSPSDWRGRALSLLEMLRLYLPLGGRPFAVYYSLGITALAAAVYGLVRAARDRAGRRLAVASLALLLLAAALVMKTPLYALLARADIFARASLVPAGLILLVVPIAVLAALGVETLTREERLIHPQSAAWIAGALIFLELFVGFGVYYPRVGERRLTFDYKREIVDFPHLDVLADSGAAGRLAVLSPAGEVLAPSYAVMPRGFGRLNLHETIFAPDWLDRAIDQALASRDPGTFDALGIGWVASTEDLLGFGESVGVAWPSVMSHYENSIFWPMRNEPGWLAWDRSVRLYRVSVDPAIVRAEPPSRSSVVAGRSAVPIDELAGLPASEFAAWLPVPVAALTTCTVSVNIPIEGATRCFAAVTAYPGWCVTADGGPLPHARAADAFLAFDVPAGASDVTMRFRPTHFTFAMLLAFAATVVAAAAAGATTRRTAPPRAAARPCSSPRPPQPTLHAPPPESPLPPAEGQG